MSTDPKPGDVIQMLKPIPHKSIESGDFCVVVVNMKLENVFVMPGLYLKVFFVECVHESGQHVCIVLTPTEFRIV